MRGLKAPSIVYHCRSYAIWKASAFRVIRVYHAHDHMPLFFSCHVFFYPGTSGLETSSHSSILFFFARLIRCHAISVCESVSTVNVVPTGWNAANFTSMVWTLVGRSYVVISSRQGIVLDVACCFAGWVRSLKPEKRKKSRRSARNREQHKILDMRCVTGTDVVRQE